MAPRFDSILKQERERSGKEGGTVSNICVACVGDLADGFSTYKRCLLPDRTQAFALFSEEGHLHICCNECRNDGSRDCLEVTIAHPAPFRGILANADLNRFPPSSIVTCRS